MDSDIQGRCHECTKATARDQGQRSLLLAAAAADGARELVNGGQRVAWQAVRLMKCVSMCAMVMTSQSTAGFTRLLLMLFLSFGEFSGQSLLNVKPRFERD